ncbi:MAG: type II toxin-antitoxin system RelE/ParE family toxin [Candidatus Diapherotrites archaeon]|nr:type II toxin-antitoxin system RelE/ParE family toxin [Candidatus Diapherotrites archaeon]
MAQNIFYSTCAVRQIKKLDNSLKIQLSKKISELRENPELGKPLGNILKNKRSLHIGKFRVLYSIKEKDIIIAEVGHRKNICE